MADALKSEEAPKEEETVTYASSSKSNVVLEKGSVKDAHSEIASDVSDVGRIYNK